MCRCELNTGQCISNKEWPPSPSLLSSFPLESVTSGMWWYCTCCDVMMVGDRRSAVSLVFTSAPPPKKKKRLVLDESGLCCASAVLCCGVKPLPLTQKGGAPSLDRPVFFRVWMCPTLCVSVFLLIFPVLYLSVIHLICVFLIFILRMSGARNIMWEDEVFE